MSNMTNEEKLGKIAEACGWKIAGQTDEGLVGYYRPVAGIESAAQEAIPDFPKDLNACAQFETTLELGHDGSQWDDYQQTLWGIVNPDIDFNPDNLHDVAYLKNLISATAAQCCEAFLETIRE